MDGSWRATDSTCETNATRRKPRRPRTGDHQEIFSFFSTIRKTPPILERVTRLSLVAFKTPSKLWCHFFCDSIYRITKEPTTTQGKNDYVTEWYTQRRIGVLPEMRYISSRSRNPVFFKKKKKYGDGLKSKHSSTPRTIYSFREKKRLWK